MSDEEAEGAPAQNPGAQFSGNITNFEQPKLIQCSPRKLPRSIQEKSVDTT